MYHNQNQGGEISQHTVALIISSVSTFTPFSYSPIFISKYITTIQSSGLAAPVDEASHRWCPSTGLEVIDRRLVFWGKGMRHSHLATSSYPTGCHPYILLPLHKAATIFINPHYSVVVICVYSNCCIVCVRIKKLNNVYFICLVH